MRLAGCGVVRCLILGVVALLLSACGSAVPAPSSQPPPGTPAPAPAAAPTGAAAPASPGAATALPFQPLASGQAARYDQPASFIVVVGDPARLGPVWGQHIASDAPPAAVQQLDFNQKLLILVSYGRRNTGGYGIAVRGVERQGNDVVVMVETRNPVPGALLPQVITTPWEAIAVERSPLTNWAALRYVVRDSGGRTLAETVPQSAGAGP